MMLPWYFEISGERWERMKNSGTRKAMQTPIRKSICAMLCLLLLLSAVGFVCKKSPLFCVQYQYAGFRAK